MKILHLSLKSLVIDGWNYQDNMLTKYHRKLGHEVMDITSKWIYDKNGNLIEDDRAEYINDDGVIMVRLQMKGKESFNRRLQHYEGLYERIDAFSPAIIFMHSVNFTDISLVTKYLKKHQNVQLYVDNHADRNNSGRNWLSYNILHRVIWRHYAKSLIPYAKMFYGVTPNRRKFLTEAYNIPEEKTELLVMGADDSLIISAQNKNNISKFREANKIKDDEILIVTGGKINSNRPETLTFMKAFKKCSIKNVKLIVFGIVVDELREEFEKLVDGKTIQYIGWVNPDKTYEVFAASDFVVFPGLHSVFWEQVVALGKPMLCKKIEGMSHIDIGGNVRFVNTMIEGEIEKALLDIFVDEKNFNSMKIAALSEKRNDFLYSRIAQKSIEWFH